jgi:DUF4097 and DUF4098 domain-containing protein YvlB
MIGGVEMRTLFLVSALAFSVLCGCDRGDWNSKQHYVRSQTIHVPLSPSVLSVRSTNASVELRVDPSSPVTTIVAEFEIDSTSVADANDRLRASSLVHDTESNRLVLETDLREDVSVHLKITMPEVTGVSIETDNGSVRIIGASGEAYVKTSNGDVAIHDQQGSVTVRTQNGSIAVSHPTEFLELHTENGSIDITNAVSDIRARSANGAIELSVDADRTPSLQIFASNGAITVSVGAAFTGEIDLVADNGSIQLEDEAGKVTAEVLRDDGSRHLVIGGGVNKSTLRSSNGSVRFTILPDPRAGDPGK